MNTADFCFFGFVALLTIVGIFKGFVKTIIDLFSGIIAFAAAALLAQPITARIGGLPLFDPSKEKIRTFFLDRASGASESIGSAIDKLSIPDFIKSFILKDAGDPAGLLTDGADALAKTVFTVMLTAIVFLLIMVLIRIIFFLLEKTIEKLFKKVKLLKAVNHVLGGVLGLVNAIFLTYVVLAILAMTSSTFPGAAASVSDSAIVSRLYLNNLLLNLLAARSGL